MTENAQLTTFISCLESGDRKRCLKLVQEWEQQKLPNEVLYSDILIPALIHIGTAWEENRKDIVEEHVATQIIKTVLAYKAATVEAREDLGKTALVGCVPDEHHDVASMVIANSLEEQGWRVLHYGSSVPVQDLISSAKRTRPDLVCLTMKSIGCLESTLDLLKGLREALPGTSIMLGGMHSPTVRAMLSEHADIIADTLSDGLRRAEELARR